MDFKNFVFNSFQVNATLVTLNGKSILFDAPFSSNDEFLQFENYINSINSTLCAVVLTHAHIDHVVGCKQVQQKHNVPIYLHSDDLPLLDVAPNMAEMFGFRWDDKPDITNILYSEEEINIEGIPFSSLHVPGHSPGSLAYYFEEDKKIITGDVLFSGSIGRTDLPGGNHEVLISGIKEKLLILPEDIEVLPGHGPNTTIGSEKKQNPFL